MWPILHGNILICFFFTRFFLNRIHIAHYFVNVFNLPFQYIFLSSFTNHHHYYYDYITFFSSSIFFCEFYYNSVITELVVMSHFPYIYHNIILYPQLYLQSPLRNSYIPVCDGKLLIFWSFTQTHMHAHRHMLEIFCSWYTIGPLWRLSLGWSRQIGGSIKKSLCIYSFKFGRG